MSPFVELTFEGPLARIALKRADKLNALDGAMVEALADAARAIDASREARVAILIGEGKAFCAGGDIAAWGGLPALDMWRDWTRAGHRAFEALARLRVPLIAALTGHAFGGGLELAAVADIRVAESGVKLGLPESGLGMAPGWSGTQRLVRRFGPSVVRRMALAGRMFTAEEGLALGLVDEVTPPGEGARARRCDRRRHRQARPGRGADRQGDDQRRRGRGPRRADRRARGRADGDDAGPRRGRRGVPRQARAELRRAIGGLQRIERIAGSERSAARPDAGRLGRAALRRRITLRKRRSTSITVRARAGGSSDRRGTRDREPQRGFWRRRRTVSGGRVTNWKGRQ